MYFNCLARTAPGIENGVSRASPGGRVLFLVFLWPGGQRAQDSALPQQPGLSRDSRYFSQINTITEGYPTAAANIQQPLSEDSSTPIKKLSQTARRLKAGPEGKRKKWKR